MYEHQNYPKWVYKNSVGKIVNNSDEHEDAKTDGWGDHKEAPIVEVPKEEPPVKPESKKEKKKKGFSR